MDVHLFSNLLMSIPVNHPHRVVWQGIFASLQPAVRPPDLNFNWRNEGQRIFIQSSPWGDIGFLTINVQTLSQVNISFYLSPFPTQQETEQVESAIRDEILNHRPTHGDLLNNPEMTQKPCGCTLQPQAYLVDQSQGLACLRLRNMGAD
jgi:hypothetical protein